MNIVSGYSTDQADIHYDLQVSITLKMIHTDSQGTENSSLVQHDKKETTRQKRRAVHNCVHDNDIAHAHDCREGWRGYPCAVLPLALLVFSCV